MVSLGRVIGGTVYPGLTLTVGTIWCSNFLSKCILGYLPVNKGSEGYWSWTNGTRCALALSSPLGRLSLALASASPSAMRVSVQTPEILAGGGGVRSLLARGARPYPAPPCSSTL